MLPLVDRIPLGELRLGDRLADVWAVMAVLDTIREVLAYPALNPLGGVERALSAAVGVVRVLVGDKPLCEWATL